MIVAAEGSEHLKKESHYNRILISFKIFEDISLMFVEYHLKHGCQTEIHNEPE